MNMDRETQEFEKLRKLLALKRLEMPPQGYFDTLPDKIISRIQSDESSSDENLLLLFWRLLKNKPIIGFATAVALIALVGLASRSFNDSEASISIYPPHNNPWELAQPSHNTSLAENTPSAQLSQPSPDAASSTNPVSPAESMPSLFQSIQLKVTPVNYTPSNK